MNENSSSSLFFLYFPLPTPFYSLVLLVLTFGSYQIGIRADYPRPVRKQSTKTMPRIDDVQQQLQQSIDDLRGKLSSQAEQLQGQLAAHRETQERAHAQLGELITGLSLQVMQLTNRTPDIGTAGGNNLSRLSRIDFPKFEGDDVQGWSYKCEQFFELDAITENKKVKIAAIHLSGRALVWHQSFMKQFTEEFGLLGKIIKMLWWLGLE